MTQIAEVLEQTITIEKIQRIALAFQEVGDAFAAARLFLSAEHFRKEQRSWEAIRDMRVREEGEGR